MNNIIWPDYGIDNHTTYKPDDNTIYLIYHVGVVTIMSIFSTTKF